MPGSTLEFTPEALQTITAMQERVALIGNTYGQSSDEYRQVLESLVVALVSVIRLGGRISKDGDLSLFGASFIAYGVVWHAKRRGGERDELLGEWGCHS